MSSLEMILILALFLNFASDSHSLQETSPTLPEALNFQQSVVPLVTSCSCSSTLDTKNVTDSKIPEAPVLSSLEEFCSAKVMDSIGLVYHVGSHLLLSVTQEPNGSVSGNQTNDTVKQWFYVYNWKTGDLYHRMVGLEEIFVIPEALKPHGPLVFATTICMSVQTCTQESQLVVATFSTPNSSMESHTCLDMIYPSQTSNQFLSTRMFRLAESSEGVFVPKLSLQSIELEQIQLRGRIGFGGGILIREELACPRMGTTNSTAVQYASGFTLPDRLILQTKPGFVQIGPNGKEISISKMLNCPPFLGSNSSSVFPNELKLITEGSEFYFFGLLDTIYDAILNNLGIFAFIAGAAIGSWLAIWLIVPILEELLDDYTDKDHQPAPEIHPEQIHYV